MNYTYQTIVCVILGSKLILEVAFWGDFRLSARLQRIFLFLCVFISGVFQTLLYIGTHA